MNEKLVTIVKALYQCLATQDWETYQFHLHPEFRVVESDSLPYPGTFYGMDGFNKLFGIVLDQFSEFEPMPSRICAGEDHVMVWVDIKMTGRKSGKSIHTQLIEVFRFSGDKLIEIRPFYFDTDLIKSVL